MVRFTDSNVIDDYPPRQRDNPSRNGRWSPDYHYAGGAAPPSPGGSGGGGPYMTGPLPAPTTQAPPRYAGDPPTSPVLTRENSLQVPHWDRYRPRSVPPPMSPTNDNSTMVFPPPRSRSRNHDRDREVYHDRDRHEDRSSRRKPADRETKGRHKERYYDSDSSSSSGDDRKGNKPNITRSRTPMSKARSAFSSTFSDSTSGLGAGVIGAIVGGLAAREASENLLAKGDGHGHGGHHHHSGKEALLSTIAGAAVGALGANAIEKRIESSRKKHSFSSSSAASPTKGSVEGKNYTWGDERRRSSLTEDKRERASGGRDKDRDRDRDRERETYKERDIRRDRSQRRGSKEEDRHRYYTSDDEDDEIVYDYKKRGAPRDRSRPRRDDDDWRGGR